MRVLTTIWTLRSNSLLRPRVWGVIHDGVSTFKLTDSEFAALTGSLIPPRCREWGHT